MGKYPVVCVEDMVKISKAIEEDLKYWKRFDSKGNISDSENLKSNIAYIACETAEDVNADAIVVYSHTGETANFLSGFRPACPILAITDNKKTYHKLALDQGVVPVFVEAEDTIDNTIGKGINKLQADGILEAGDKVVVAGGNKILPLEKESQVIGGIMRI